MVTYDYRKLRKEYHKLGVPDDLFDPSATPLENNKYFVICTERASGKTTNVLLFGLVAYKIYGTPIQYIREYDEQLAPKNARNLCDVIIQYGYVPKLTDGRYNTMIYKARRWYYAKEEDGEIKETAAEPCIQCLSIQSCDTYKSSYNAPKGDFIIFDEFCAKRHQPDAFFSFCDLLSTIIRSRQNPIIWMLGNTIDRYEYFFDELEIADYMKFIQIGDSMEVKTAKGTPIYIEVYLPHQREKKSLINKLFFGFKNSKLNAITGDDWLIVPYQHIDAKDDRETIDRRHYIQYESDLLCLEVCNSDRYGLHVVVHRATRNDYEDAIIYSCDRLQDIRYHFRFGFSKIDKMIWTLYDRNKFFYATNACAAIMGKYINLARNTTP